MRRSITGIGVLLTALLSAGCVQNNLDNIDAELLLSPPNDLSDYQVEIIQDGIVTEAEYVQAVDDHSLCMQQEGFDADQPIWDNEGIRYSFGISYQGYESQPEDELQAALDAQQKSYDRCQKEYSSFVERYWLYSQKPTGAEWERQYQEYERCLMTHEIFGITSVMSDSEIIEEIMTYPQNIQETVFLDCVYKYWILYYE